MSKQEDFGRSEKPLEKMWEIDNEAKMSKKAKMKRKLNRNQEQITLSDIQINSLTSLDEGIVFKNSHKSYNGWLFKEVFIKRELTYKIYIGTWFYV